MITVNARPRSASGAPRWTRSELQTTATPFPRPATTTQAPRSRRSATIAAAPMPSAISTIPNPYTPADAEPRDRGAGGDAAERQPETVGADEQPEADVRPRRATPWRAPPRATLTAGVAELDDVPREEHGQKRARAEDEPESVARRRPSARGSRSAAACSRAAGILASNPAETRNVTALIQYARSGPAPRRGSRPPPGRSSTSGSRPTARATLRERARRR